MKKTIMTDTGRLLPCGIERLKSYSVDDSTQLVLICGLLGVSSQKCARENPCSLETPRSTRYSRFSGQSKMLSVPFFNAHQ